MAEEKVVDQAKEKKAEVAATPRNKVADFSNGGVFNSSDSFSLARQM